VTLPSGYPVAEGEVETARDRKAEHIRLALEERMQVRRSWFDDYRFEHCALPEIALDEIDLGTSFLGRELASPLLISCMTGGTPEAGRINHHLAIAAESSRIAIGVGSQRKALEDSAQAESFRIRELAPSVPLLANLGAVQLNYGFGLDECRAAIEMIEADALVLHLNPLQEAIQPEGQADFRGLLDKIGEVASALEVPLIVKEIGSGISAFLATELADRGVRILDTAGVGGTSWARIEAARAEQRDLGEIFGDWGIPTPESIRQLHGIEGLTIIGSGGVRNGLDVAKCVTLGADLVGLAQPFLRPASESPERVVEAVKAIRRELEIAMFCVGARTLDELREASLHREQPFAGPAQGGG